ncbi:hypothetical protein BCR42DRAFT_426106 [Absidia repens]|uniref:DUF7721 domain-containing protein n=1 Tax=Absidia repens TaxID=90262 RepID=A0A1X2I1E4_9FUNG|nr:hypothetical protein BCR42DRAFT_426106 [Absidia repens]
MSYRELNKYQAVPQVPQVIDKCLNVNDAARYAAEHSEKEESMFLSVLSTVVDDDNSKRPALEQETNEIAEIHYRIYIQGRLSEASSKEIGKAAALQALKMATNTDLGTDVIPDRSKFIGLAMGEAINVLRYDGGAGSGAGGTNQNEALHAAAATAMRLYMSKNGDSQGGSGDFNVDGIDASMLTNVV